jgi:hypothetical protein
VIAEAAATPATTGLGVIDQLLRDRAAVVARISRGQDLVAITRVMVATIAIAMAIVGAALGYYRGGTQIAYAAIKLPLVMLGTAALSAPALSAIGAALGRRSRLSCDLALVMTALAFGSLLLASCTPLILLGHALNVGYHQMILLTVGTFALAGVASLWMVYRELSIEAAPGRRSAIAGFCLVFALVGSQLAWSLRPYLVRTRGDVVFIREIEDSLFDAITTTFQSARGIYTRDAAPLPEEHSHDAR